jgi:CBS-domain-containing membrane protein
MADQSFFKTLQQKKLTSFKCFVIEPQAPNHVILETNALETMTDLSERSCATVSPTVSLHEANRILINRGVRMLVVSDEQHCVAGLLTSTDLLGEKPIRYAQDFGRNVTELQVSDIMIPKAEVEVLDYADVTHASVGDIVNTLKASGRGHCLVVRPRKSTSDNTLELVGIFSATQIARQLGIHIHTHEIAKTFAEVEKLFAA